MGGVPVTPNEFATVSLLKALVNNTIADLMILRTALESSTTYELYKALTDAHENVIEVSQAISTHNVDVIKAVTGSDYLVGAVEYDIRNGDMEHLEADIAKIARSEPEEAERLSRLAKGVSR